MRRPFIARQRAGGSRIQPASKIAKKLYGDANHYEKIFEADKDQLTDPDKIKVTLRGVRDPVACGLLLALAASVTSTAVPPARAAEGPNILWLTTEDISPAVGAFGDDDARTPNLDRLARDGVVYTRAYASAPICSPSRSALITGVYATSLGTQHLRSSIRIPESIRTLPEYLRERGYYTSNNSKTDYNFDPSGRWDESTDTAHWRHRRPGQPFFSVFNITTTHEGSTNDLDEKVLEGMADRHDPARARLPPYFPDTPEM
ncbi:MAG TPA: sulfatase-like hydrolase/transferase, partial [Coriobacteriia bacterium]